MKLELKNLAPYLPYGLKFKELTIGKELKMNGCEYTHELRIRLTDGLYSCKASNLKPILRPLSDLNKQITHDGLTFTPCHVLARMAMEKVNRADFDIRSNKYDYHTLITNLECYNKLLEWHFDVFGLIPNGLAIDINTL